MKILIFGGSGFIGGNIAYYAKLQGWKVFIADKRRNETLKNIFWNSINISNYKSVEQYIETIFPDVVVNTAAIADIDLSENNKEAAILTNVTGAINIAKACAKNKIKYIFFSSDAVFDGKQKNYSEESELGPMNFYGKTKAESETLISKILPESTIVRVSLVLGFPLGQGNSYLASLKKKLQDNEQIIAPTDIIRTPIDVHTLSNAIIELSQIDFSGIMHIGCLENVTRFVLTQMLAKQLGLPTENIKPQGMANAPQKKAPRHRNGILDVSKARKMLTVKMLTLDETIKKSVQQIDIKKLNK